MATKLEVSAEIGKIVTDTMLDTVRKELGISEFKDEDFKVIQPYSGDQAIILLGGLNENGEYGIEVNVNDFTMILPKIEAELNIFGSKSKGEQS